MNDVDRLFACFKCGISPPSKFFISFSLSSSSFLLDTSDEGVSGVQQVHFI